MFIYLPIIRESRGVREYYFTEVQTHQIGMVHEICSKHVEAQVSMKTYRTIEKETGKGRRLRRYAYNGKNGLKKQ